MLVVQLTGSFGKCHGNKIAPSAHWKKSVSKGNQDLNGSSEFQAVILLRLSTHRLPHLLDQELATRGQLPCIGIPERGVGLRRFGKKTRRDPGCCKGDDDADEFHPQVFWWREPFDLEDWAIR